MTTPRSAATATYGPTAWTLPTLASARAPRATASARFAGEALAAVPAAVEGTAPAKVRCHCGRPEWPAHLIDIRGLPAGCKRWPGQVWACNGCIEVMVAERLCSRRRMYRLLGAPAAAIARIQAYAQARGEFDDDD